MTNMAELERACGEAMDRLPATRGDIAETNRLLRKILLLLKKVDSIAPGAER